MGMTYVSVGISKTRHGPKRTIRLLVDTGASDSILPSVFLRRLGVRPEWREEYELANGELMVREVGRLYVHYLGRSMETSRCSVSPRTPAYSERTRWRACDSRWTRTPGAYGGRSV
ncbi:MAG TPA: retroviral-like aspartic protease family protein [Thermoplasmata archaeon]|nr:retroviral-like aspartic protease family protein [Thermoplasmata archaeon]